MTSLRLKWGQVVWVWWSWTWRFALYSLIITIIALLPIAVSQETSIVSLDFLELFLGLFRELFLFLDYPAEEIHPGFWGLLVSLAPVLVYFLAFKKALEVHVPLLNSTNPSDRPALARKYDQDGDDHLANQRHSTSKPAKNGEREITKLRLTWVRVVWIWWSWKWRLISYFLIMAIVVLLIGATLEKALAFFSPGVLPTWLLILLALALIASIVLFSLVLYFLTLKIALEIHVPLLTSTGAGGRSVPNHEEDKDGDGDDHLVS